jgi:hypothetical protein
MMGVRGVMDAFYTGSSEILSPEVGRVGFELRSGQWERASDEGATPEIDSGVTYASAKTLK